MSNRLLLPIALFAVAAACNRTPAPQPDKADTEHVVANYQAATPASGGAGGASAPMAGGTPMAGGMPSNASGGSAAMAAAVSPLNDSQIARITNDANSAEVDQGKVAQGKAKEPRVKQFAERMVKHHTEAKEKQAKLKLDTAPSDMAMKLERDADKTLSELKADSGANFDAEYMADQVKEHQHVLDVIDQQLLPNAKNEDLKAYLRDIRPTVASHLKDARDIQSKLNDQPGKLTQQPAGR